MTTYSALYYHLIWATKRRLPLIPEIIENKFYSYITGIVQNKTSTLIQVGGMADHIHLLIRINPDQQISELVRIIKISSGKWLKETVPTLREFCWQTGFGAFSVSKSQTDMVRDYIAHQKEHHKHRSFDQEWLACLQNHGIEYDKNYVFG